MVRVAMLVRRLAIVAIVVVGGAAAAGAFVASTLTPTIPADAASAVLARTSIAGQTTSDCLDRVERPGGWLDLCWHVIRQPDDDPSKDYYLLRVTGTLSGEKGGVRWSVVRARLVGAPAADGVFDGWPHGTVDGRCAVHSPGLGFGGASEEVCGRTSGMFIGAWNYQVSWACVGCILPDRSDRPVVLYFSVGVAEGAVPAWEIGADFGS